MASVAVLTAVSNPNDRWVPLTSLSMVLGTQTTGSPLFHAPAVRGDVADCPAFVAGRLEGRDQIIRSIDLLFIPLRVPVDIPKGISAVGGPQYGTAKMSDAAHLGRAERNYPVKAE